MKVRALPTCRKPVGEGAKRTRSESTDKLSFLRGVEEFGMKLTCYGRAKKRVKRLRVRIQRRMMFSAEPKTFCTAETQRSLRERKSSGTWTWSFRHELLGWFKAVRSKIPPPRKTRRFTKEHQASQSRERKIRNEKPASFTTQTGYIVQPNAKFRFSRFRGEKWAVFSSTPVLKTY